MKGQIIKVFLVSFLLFSTNLAFATVDNILDTDLQEITTTSTSSLNYSDYDWNTVTWNMVIDNMSEDDIKNDIIVDWWNLKIDTNVDILKYKIILKNAKSLVIWTNVHIASIEWTVDNIDIDTNADIDSMVLTVSWDTKIDVNVWIKKINLKTNNLNLSTNSEIWDWIIYVYKNFSWWVNGDFNWKFTVYWDSSLDVNSDFKWRFCSLWKVWLWVNTDLETYNNDWLFWNIDPILNYTTEDSSKDFSSAKEISEWFDTRFAKAMKDIDTYNAQISSLASKLKLAKDEDKPAIQSEIDSKKTSKEELKNSFIEDINTTFDTLAPMIDEKVENKDLFQNIKEMYISAIELEDDLLVYQICNNSEVSWDTNSVYVKWWKIMYWNTYFKREQIIQDKQEEVLEKRLDKMSDERILNITTKVDKLLETFAKKWYSQKNAKNMNTLMDVKDLLREATLY